MRMNRTSASLALALAATFGMSAASADAALMVDFNDNHVPGGDWETIAEPGSYTLSDGTTLTFVAPEGTNWADSAINQPAQNSGYAETRYENVARDYIFSSQSAKSIVLGNLEQGTSYSLYLISARDSSSNVGDIATITVNGNAATGDHDAGDYRAKTDGWDDGTVLRWDDVTPDEDGNITITFEGSGNSSYFANGFVLVPEPASMGLFGIGALVLFARRRTTA